MNIEDAVSKLQQAVKTLDGNQGRIARRNARRRVFGAMRALRNTVQAGYPAIQLVRAQEDSVEKAARVSTWRDFEHRVIKYVTLDWDVDVAQAFADHVTTARGVKRREIVIEDMRGRLLGMCHSDKIRLDSELYGSHWWRTLIHELAHAICPNGGRHGRAFVKAMAEVYGMWKDFRRQMRTAASRRQR